MKKSSLYIAPLLVLSLATGFQPIAYSQENTSSIPKTNTNGQDFDALVEQYKKKQEAVTNTVGTQIRSTEEELRAEQARLEAKNKELNEINNQIQNYELQINELQTQIRDLNNQLEIITSSIELTQLKIRAVRIQLAEKEQDIYENTQKVEIAQVALESQEGVIAKFISLIFKQDQLYFSKKNSLSLDPTLYLGGEQISDVLMRRKYLETLQQTGKAILSDLRDVKVLLDVQQTQLSNDQERFSNLKDRLKQEEIILGDQKKAKELLVIETQGKEENFTQLLALSQQEQVAIEQEVQDLQSTISDIELKIQTFQTSISSSSLTDEEIKARLKALAESGVNENGKLQLQWPVPPHKGLSAYFRDPSYTKVFGVPHSAIDIPTPQGTEIKAPADGYVTKVKDSGLGYSYIIVAHTGGVMTLYGHVSKIMVNAGDLVRMGDTIGLSGGQPGTAGAGWMTTGAHLHLEVFQNGQHADPLQYLDNSLLGK